MKIKFVDNNIRLNYIRVEFIMTFISSYFSFKFAYRDLVSVTPNQHEYLNIVLSVI